MNKNKLIAYLITCILLFSIFSNEVSAHDEICNLQHHPTYTNWNILEYYNDSSKNYSDSIVGYWACHTNSTNITYSYGDFSNDIKAKNYIDEGIAKWNNVVFTDALGTRHVISITHSETNPYITFKNNIYMSDHGGADFPLAMANGWYTHTGNEYHLTKLNINLNSELLDDDTVKNNIVITPSLQKWQHVITHEVGHAIGLDDLNSSTWNVLMNGGGLWKTQLTSYDIQGAAVILGVHTNNNHVFNAPVSHRNNFV